MKLLCKILFLAFVATVVVSGCDVNTEVNRIFNEIAACSEHVYNETTQPFDFIRYYANFRLTYDEAKDKIIDYCNVFEHQNENCLRPANTAIDAECGSDQIVSRIIDVNDIGFHMDTYLCEGGAQRYLEFLENDGPDCFAKNDNYETCLDNYYNAHPDVEFVKCITFELGLECIRAYDDCENQNVRTHFNDVNVQLQSIYECEN